MFSQHLHSMSCCLSKYTRLISIYPSFPAAVNRSLCTEPIRDRERDCGRLSDRWTHTSVAKDGAGVKCGDFKQSLWTILGNCESCTSKSEVCSDCVSVWQVVVENYWTSTERAIPAFRREGMATQRTRSSSNKHCRAIRMATNVASESWKDRSLTCQRENTFNHHHQEYLVQLFKGTVYPKRKMCR